MSNNYLQGIMYAILTVIILVILGAGVRFFGVFSERVVFENSFQYKKGMESRALTLQSQIAEVEANILKDPSMAETLTAQKKVLLIQLQATKL